MLVFRYYQQEKNTVCVLDDPFGKGTIDCDKIKKWNDNEDKLKQILRFEEQENFLTNKKKVL